jgi:FtsP/CotA-like multicopper oxidase with cupredoxin domain
MSKPENLGHQPPRVKVSDPPRSDRRTFLSQAAAGVGAGSVPAALGLTVAACADGSTNAPNTDTTNTLSTKQATATSATVRAQLRQVQWVPGVNPIKPNAWVYAQDGVTRNGILSNAIGPVFNVRRDSPFTVTWINEIPALGLGSKLMTDPPILPPLANGLCGAVTLQSNVGIVTHLHGARVLPASDGTPTQPLGFAGNPYGFPSQITYAYPNAQRASMLWYHDHALDNTGANVYAGLVGLYFLRDTFDDTILNLLGGSAKELPIVIQDKVLTPDRTAIDYSATMVSTGAVLRPEALGSTIFVNGQPGTDLPIARTNWRLRLLNASNSRSYALALYDPDALAAGNGQVWYSHCLRLIGTDSGFASKSVKLAPTDVLIMASGQRRDVLLDLTALPAQVKRLKLGNLSLASFLASNAGTPEGIYTTFANSVVPPSSAWFNNADQTLYAALTTPIASVAGFSVAAATVTDRNTALNQAATLSAIESTLLSASNDDDFLWNGTTLTPKSGIGFGPNRLILPISNTSGFTTTEFGNGIQGWSDVQIFEMQDRTVTPSVDNARWQLPFSIDLLGATNPRAGTPSLVQNAYTIARRSFFQSRRNPDITVAGRYPLLASPTISAKAGTYERWYVANIGNSQPLTSLAGLPDMHPFHIHLVSFVVTNRWALDASAAGQFVPVAKTSLDLDNFARQDTVMIPSGQIVELLVYYPAGYSGDYVYHCHLLEHEDKCMMSTFRVSAATPAPAPSPAPAPGPTPAPSPAPSPAPTPSPAPSPMPPSIFTLIQNTISNFLRRLFGW